MTTARHLHPGKFSQSNKRGKFAEISTRCFVVSIAAFGLSSLPRARAATLPPPFPVGLYVNNPDGSNESTFDGGYLSFGSAVSARPHFILNYIDYTQQVAAWPSNASWQAWSNATSRYAKNLVPVVALPMASIASGSGSADQQFQAFASGQYDSAIEGVVLAYAQQGFARLVFRPGWEMNIQGPTYVGDDAQSQQDWVLAFRHITQILRQAAGWYNVSVQVIWNPSATNYSNASATGSLYPGDDVVDMVGIDMYSDIYPYSDGGTPATYHDWDTGQEDTSVAQFIADPVNRMHYWSYPAATKWSLDGSSEHSQSLDSLIQFALAHNKPIAIPETGAGNSNAGTDVNDDAIFPQWLSQDLQNAVVAGGSVKLVGIWDSNGGGNYEFSFSSDNKPQETAAWAQYFGRQN